MESIKPIRWIYGLDPPKRLGSRRQHRPNKKLFGQASCSNSYPDPWGILLVGSFGSKAPALPNALLRARHASSRTHLRAPHARCRTPHVCRQVPHFSFSLSMSPAPSMSRLARGRHEGDDSAHSRTRLTDDRREVRQDAREARFPSRRCRIRGRR